MKQSKRDVGSGGRDTQHRQRLIRYYGRIARALLNDPRFQQQLRDLTETNDEDLRSALQKAREAPQIAPVGGVPTVAKDAVAQIRRSFGLPHDWDFFVWSAAVNGASNASYPIAPSFLMASMPEGYDAGFFIGFSTYQLVWWNTGALDHAIKTLKRGTGPKSKPGRQPDYLKACELAREYQQLHNWGEIWRQRPEAEGDPTAARRQAKRFERRGYR